MAQTSHLKSFTRRAIEWLPKQFGYSLVSNWRLENLRQAELLSKLLRRLAIDCVIDVGANQGQFGRFLRNEVEYRGHIVSYEPQPELATQLSTESEGESAWQIRNCAVGSKPGELLLNVMAQSEFSSFLSPSATSNSSIDSMNTIQRTISVPVTTLSTEIPRIRGELGVDSFFLKTDTQGFDLQVIEGAGSFLSEIRGIQFEGSFVPIYDRMPSFTEMIAFLGARDYAVSGIFPVSRSQFPILLECDVVVTNKRYC